MADKPFKLKILTVRSYITETVVAAESAEAAIKYANENHEWEEDVGIDEYNECTETKTPFFAEQINSLGSAKDYPGISSPTELPYLWKEGCVPWGAAEGKEIQEFF
jgi:hypothetical protein